MLSAPKLRWFAWPQPASPQPVDFAPLTRSLHLTETQHSNVSHQLNLVCLQDKELDLKEREEAVRRMHNEADYNRCEAEANLRSQKEESAALARKTEALSEARARQARELDEREAALQDQVNCTVLPFTGGTDTDRF